jgi:epoxide hydrolase-like predicted phosphatase
VPVRAVLFDIGNVLENVPPTGWAERWEARLGLPAGGLAARTEAVVAAGSIGQLTEEEVRRRYGERLGIGPQTVDALLEDAWTEYLGTMNEELVEYVRALRPRYRTGIVSNSFVGATERERDRYAFQDLVDVIVYSHEAGCEKPDPRIYLIACDRLGVEPREAVFVDDIPEWVEAARRVGMHGIIFRDSAQAIAEIDALLGR